MLPLISIRLSIRLSSFDGRPRTFSSLTIALGRTIGPPAPPTGFARLAGLTELVVGGGGAGIELTGRAADLAEGIIK
jgi:hypothetical protein